MFIDDNEVVAPVGGRVEGNLKLDAAALGTLDAAFPPPFRKTPLAMI